MTSAEFLDRSKVRLGEQVERVRVVVEGLSDEELTKQPEPGVLSIGAVLEHLNLATEPYIGAMGAAISRGADEIGDMPKQTFLGRYIAKAAGPEGSNKVPMPPPMVPGEKQTSAVVGSWFAFQEQVGQLIDQAQGKDLNKSKFKNPFMPLFSFNLFDGFTIMLEHNERHIRQIEERVLKIRKS